MDHETLIAKRDVLRAELVKGREHVAHVEGAIMLLNELIEQAERAEEPEPASEE